MFAQMMLPHHQQAIEMSNILLAKGSSVDADVVALATTIKQEQGPEIPTLSGWLKDWNQKTSSSMGPSMTGTMSEADLSTLNNATGSEAGKLFLTEMIQHHTGAIDMANAEVSQGKNPNAIALAMSIVKSQSAEISKMKVLLAS